MHFPRLIEQHEFWLDLLVVALVVGLSVSTGEFLSLGSLMDVATGYAILGILVRGLFVVLISDGIDISLPAVIAITQYVMASWVIGHSGNSALTLIIAIAVGLLLGLINGSLVYWLRVPAIIIIIAALNVYYGLLVYATKGTWLYNFPDWFMNDINQFSFTAADGYDYGLTLPLLYLAVVIIFTVVLTNYTRPGCQIYAMGGNHDAASRLGLGLLKLHSYVYGYMGILASVAAMVQAQITQSIAPNSLLGSELTTLATVILGGTNIGGRRGMLIGTLFGVVLLAFLQDGLTLLGIFSCWHTVFSGATILVNISAVAWNEKHKLAREL